MRQPVRLPASDRDRITALETARNALEAARKADDERFKKIEDMVTDIHGILTKARGFKWVLDGCFKYTGQISMASAAAYGLWKFTGH